MLVSREERLEVSPQNAFKKPIVVAHSYNPRARKKKQTYFRCSQADSLGASVSFRSTERLCLHREGGQCPRNDAEA